MNQKRKTDDETIILYDLVDQASFSPLSKYVIIGSGYSAQVIDFINYKILEN